MSLYTRFSARDKTQYEPDISTVLGSDHWRVLEGFRYYIGDKECSLYVYIPAGYLTDGASVPRLFHNVVGPWGKHGQAAIVHDYLCEYLTFTKEILIDGIVITKVKHSITRAECDKIFLEAMTVLEVPTLRKNIMYRAVSLFRRVAKTENPSLNIIKLNFEVEWRKANNISEPYFNY